MRYFVMQKVTGSVNKEFNFIFLFKKKPYAGLFLCVVQQGAYPDECGCW